MPIPRKQRLRRWFRIGAIVTVCAALLLGIIWFFELWAPGWHEGGLALPDTTIVLDADGNPLSAAVTAEFIAICRSLPSTTRSIGEDRGSGYIAMRSGTPPASESITVYSWMNVVFAGWWIDAKTWDMMGQRAPCYVLTRELRRFIEKHRLLRPPG